MTIPNLPTDNLYKFLALAGVVIVLSVMYVAEQRVSELKVKSIELDYEVDVHTIGTETLAAETEAVEKDTNQLAGRVAKLGKRVEALNRELASGEDVESDIDNINEERKSVVDTLEEAERALQENVAGYAALRIEKAKLDRSFALTDYYTDRAEYVIGWAWFLLAAGNLMAWSGFLLWYLKVQQPLDRRLASGSD